MSPLFAHPHIWIDVEFRPTIQNGVMESLEILWIFDEWYSAGYLLDFDTDGNRSFDPREVANIYENAFRGLDELDYFTQITYRGRRLDIPGPRMFAADFIDGRLIYRFAMDFNQRVSAGGELVALCVDPEYYIAFFSNEVRPEGDGSLRPILRETIIDFDIWGSHGLQTMVISRR